MRADHFDRNFTISLVTYLLVGCWTFGFCWAEYRDDRSREPKAIMLAGIWPLYWPAHWSVQFWEGRLP